MTNQTIKRVGEIVSSTPTIPFIDLAAQRARIGPEIDAAIARVIDHGQYIMGPEVGALENDLTRFCGARHALSCSSGTDALLIILMAWEIGPGDAVFLPAFTFTATPEVVVLLGAAPVFVDVLPDSFNMDPESLIEAIEDITKKGELKPRVVMPVDLYGQPADYPHLQEIATRHGLKVLADAAQGFGATLNGKLVGLWGDAAATSFFPAKPLGCYGDGGAVFTDDDEMIHVLRSLRVHGKGDDKYDNIRVGLNARMDTLQAAIVIEKLAIFGDELERRNLIAGRYSDALDGIVTVPMVIAGATSAWAQYTLTTEDRDGLQQRLKERGVPSVVYYPKPLSQQTCYASFPTGPAGVPVSTKLARTVLSLPMHPYLSEDMQGYIIDSVKECI